MRCLIYCAALVALMGGCAAPAPPEPGGVVSGTIGVAVKSSADGVIVSAVGEGSPAQRAGLQVGDRVLRYNGEQIQGARQLERLMLDSTPGSIVRLEVSRGGAARTLDVPVEQMRTAIRV